MHVRVKQTVEDVLASDFERIKKEAHYLVVEVDAFATETNLSDDTMDMFRRAYMKFYEGFQILKETNLNMRRRV
jgi:hypothetical protein